MNPNKSEWTSCFKNFFEKNLYDVTIILIIVGVIYTTYHLSYVSFGFIAILVILLIPKIFPNLIRFKVALGQYELMAEQAEKTKKEFEDGFSLFLPIAIELAENGTLDYLNPRPREYFFNLLQRITKPTFCDIKPEILTLLKAFILKEILHIFKREALIDNLLKDERLKVTRTNSEGKDHILVQAFTSINGELIKNRKISNLHAFPNFLWKLSDNDKYKELLKPEEYQEFIQVIKAYKLEMEDFIENNKLSKKLLENGTIR